MPTNQSPAPGEPVVALADAADLGIELVGGKAAALGRLVRSGVGDVPDGFVVTTAAFDRVVDADPEVARLVAELTTADADRRSATAAALRDAIVTLPVPASLTRVIEDAVAGQGGAAFAVRSSATAEDLSGASFAGQHDSHLRVGAAEVVDHVRRCWASLHTGRAVRYRAEHGIDQRRVRMAVLVQRLVDAEVSGVLFSAVPTTSDRTVTVVESVPGLGDALVAGQVTAIARRVVRGVVEPVSGDPADPSTGPGVALTTGDLTTGDLVGLDALGRRIERLFGAPQDIEWCRHDGRFHVVQSRPITTLFPIPGRPEDGNRVHVSVGHQQMMTDAMKPLGLSVWQLTSPARMLDAGGRLFVDVTDRLASPAARPALLDALGRSDPRLRGALETVAARDGFLPTPDPDSVAPPPPPTAGVELLDPDPSLVTDLVDAHVRSVDALGRVLADRSGPEVFDAIVDDLAVMRERLFDPRGLQVIGTALEATWWLREHVASWLGEDAPAGLTDTLSRSAPGNVTAEMGLALLDVADAVRPHGDVIGVLERLTADDDVLGALVDVGGGEDVRRAIEGFLDRYGVRCVGEIDITRPRWVDRPGALVPTILANVRNAEPGAARVRDEAGREAAEHARRDLLDRLRALPDGDEKARAADLMIERLRTFMGYREYPKFAMISRYHQYRQALVAEARALVAAGVLDEVDDAWFLTFDELREAVATQRVDRELIVRRREDHVAFERLTPPRVITSDGEVLAGTPLGVDLPPGALAGLPVSAGTVEGRARIVLDIADADLDTGDILVTTHTDPSWSPLFTTIAGLVTEVGGVMTHGAVVAREYGLPAVVAVDGATTSLRDGQRIRVDGAAGHVVPLD